jgi:hypothetical protein
VDDARLQQRFAAGYEESGAVGDMLRADTQAMHLPRLGGAQALLVEHGARPPVAQPPRAELDLTPHVGAGAVLVGRDPACAIVLADPTVSRRHAELEVDGETCLVRDLGSTNGTHVHGRPVTATRLRAGDAVTFGLDSLRLTWRPGPQGGAKPS